MNWQTRQGFLGPDSSARLMRCHIGFVGIGGGGSHSVQQASHVGFGFMTGVDPKHAKAVHLNRLVGITHGDVKKRTPKTEIARRTALTINPKIIFRPYVKRWQEVLPALRECNVIIGAVDGFGQRDELERFCRSNLIPYIDVGMDVQKHGRQFYITGQVAMSLPGEPCMRCMGLIADHRVAEEAQRYGDAGDNPQVVWANGVLASTAIGLSVQLTTPWHDEKPRAALLEYDGNTGTVTSSRALEFLRGHGCSHHPVEDVGMPGFDVRSLRC